MKLKFIPIILLFVFSVSAQVKKPVVKPTPKPTPKTVIISITPPYKFSEDVSSLPPNFAGHTVDDIFKVVNQLQDVNALPKKDEFETTADYEKRIAEYKKNRQPIENKLVYIFNYQHAEYDADSQTLNVRTVFTHALDKIMATLKTDSSSSTYTASNAYGATTTVTKTSMLTYQIQFPKDGFSEPVVEEQFKLDIPTAREVKEKIRTLLIFELVPPYIQRESSRSEPTFTYPRESFYSTTIFSIRLRELWFIDQSSGKIFSKRKF